MSRFTGNRRKKAPTLRKKDPKSGDGFVVVGILMFFGAALIGIVGWVLNLVMLAVSLPEETGHLIVSIVGILLAPIGAVSGWVWVFM